MAERLHCDPFSYESMLPFFFLNANTCVATVALIDRLVLFTDRLNFLAEVSGSQEDDDKERACDYLISFHPLFCVNFNWNVCSCVSVYCHQYQHLIV